MKQLSSAWLILIATVLVALLATAGAACAQAPAWQTATGADAYITATATNATDQAVYVAGNFPSQATFGATTLSNSSTKGGISYDAFVAKWDVPSQRFLWAVAVSGESDESITAIAV